MSQSGASSSNSSSTVLTINGATPLAGNINLTSTGGTITITPGAHTVNLEATNTGSVASVSAGNSIVISGTPTNPIVNVGGTTHHSVLLGNASGSINSLANGTTGQVLTANTGGDPSWVTSGGSGIITIDGDTGSISGSVVTIYAAVTALNCGSSVQFNNSGTVSTFNVTDSNQNTIIGQGSGSADLTRFSTANTCVGQAAMTSMDGGNYNTAIGCNSLKSMVTGSFDVAVGFQSLYSDQSQNNTALGYSAAFNLNNSDNVVIGANAFQTTTNGTQNVIIGSQAGQNQVAPSSPVTGNIIIGYLAGELYNSTESNNILIGSYGVTGDGTGGNLSVIRIGGSLQANCYIAGIAGITTTVPDAVPVLISASTGQLGVISSSIRYKDNIEDMGEYSSLLMRLRPVTFNYKNHLPTEISVGLIAEEVDKIMPALVIYKEAKPETIRYHELVPMLLNELQKLRKEFDELKGRL